MSSPLSPGSFFHERLGVRLREWSGLQMLLAGLAAGLVFLILATSTSPWLALAAAVGVLGMLAMIQRPELGLYATALLVPMERFGRFTNDETEFTISLMRLVGLAALGALLLHNLVRRRGLIFGKPFWWYAAYTCVGLATILYTTDRLGTVRAASTLVGNLLFFFMVVNLTTSRRVLLRALYCWLFATLLAAAYSTWDWHLGSGATGEGLTQSELDPGKGVQSRENRFSTVWQDRAELEVLGGKSVRRSMGPTSHAAVYGINLIMTVPFFLFLLRLHRKPLVRIAIMLALGLVLYNVLLTNTRGVILLAAAVMVLTVVRGLFIIHRSYVVPGLALVMLVLLVTPQDVYNRVLDVSNYSEERSASLRIREEYLVAGVKAALDHFLLGQGVGNQNIIPDYLDTTSTAPEQTTVHNEYLQTLMEVGIIGWVAFFGFVGLLLRYSIQAARLFRPYPSLQPEYWFMVAVQICMLAVLLFGLQVDVFHFPLKGWWLVAGLGYALYRWRDELVSAATRSSTESNA